MRFKRAKMCAFERGCKRGARCRFAHSIEELQMLLDSSQTSLSPEMIDSGCCTEADCKSAANPEELSQLATVKQHPISCVPCVNSECDGAASLQPLPGLGFKTVSLGLIQQKPCEPPGSKSAKDSSQLEASLQETAKGSYRDAETWHLVLKNTFLAAEICPASRRRCLSAPPFGRA